MYEYMILIFVRKQIKKTTYNILFFCLFEREEGREEGEREGERNKKGRQRFHLLIEYPKAL